MRAKVTDADGTEIPVLVEDDGHSVSWRADGVGSLGWRSYRLTKSRKKAGWTAPTAWRSPTSTTACGVDPPAAAGRPSLVEVSGDRELIADGRVGKRARGLRGIPGAPGGRRGVVAPAAQRAGGGSSAAPAESVQAYRSALGERLVECAGASATCCATRRC